MIQAVGCEEGANNRLALHKNAAGWARQGFVVAILRRSLLGLRKVKYLA